MIAIPDYLNEIEFAATQIIEALWHERTEAETLKEEIEKLIKVAEDGYNRAHFIQEFADNSEDFMDGVGTYWDTYFGADKEQHYKSKELVALEDKLITRAYKFG